MAESLRPCGETDCGGLVCEFHGLEPDIQRAILAMDALIEWAKAANMSIEWEWGTCRFLNKTGEWDKEILDAIAALA